MLGNVADAEDVLQEAALRLHERGLQDDSQKPDSEEAYLHTVISRLCIDKLRKQKVERKHYFGPWLPDPAPDDLFEPIEAQHDLGMIMMCLMDQLSPVERVAFVLREAFDFSYAEIAEMLGVSVPNVRQRACRARTRLRSLDYDSKTAQQRSQQADEHKQVLQEMVQCVQAGDSQGLIALLSEDVVAIADGGGVVAAAIAPVTGPARIAQVTMFLLNKSTQDGEIEIGYQRMNGSWSIVARQAGAIHSVSSITTRNGLVDGIYVWRNPHKMVHLRS